MIREENGADFVEWYSQHKNDHQYDDAKWVGFWGKRFIVLEVQKSNFQFVGKFTSVTKLYSFNLEV